MVETTIPERSLACEFGIKGCASSGAPLLLQTHIITWASPFQSALCRNPSTDGSQRKWIKSLYRGLRISRPYLQLGLLALATYVGLSRISDYKHHPVDVLAGTVNDSPDKKEAFHNFGKKER